MTSVMEMMNADVMIHDERMKARLRGLHIRSRFQGSLCTNESISSLGSCCEYAEALVP
jgi:hypothetical protein